MARKRSLNIHNTDRLFNLNLFTKEDENFTKVTTLTEKEVEKEMDKLSKESGRHNKRNDETYILYKQRYENATLHNKVFNHGGFVYYYTPDRVPIPVVEQLANIPYSEAIYFCQKEYSVEEITNIQLTSMATQVSVDVPIVLPDINPYDYLFALYPLRYHIDKVRVSFPPLQESEMKERYKPYYSYDKSKKEYHLKSQFKFDCFTYLHEPLSTWKMNIWLLCDDEEDKEEINRLVKKNYKRFNRKPSTDKEAN